jgi:hypothetical protein
MPGYNPKKAAAYNQLRQQGLSEDQAARQAGISEAEDRFYEVNDVGSNNPKDASYNPNRGKMGPPVQGAQAAEYNNAIASGKTEEQAYAELQARRAEAKAERAASRDEDDDEDELFERSPVAINEKTPPGGKVTPINYVTTSTETVSGGGSTNTVSGAPQPTPASRSLQPAIDAKQAEQTEFIKNNPSNYARAKQGLPPLTPEESQQRTEKLGQLSAEKEALVRRQENAEAPGAPTVTTTPNTTTTTQTVTTGTAATNQQVDPLNDEKLSQENEAQLDATTSAANASTARSAAPVAAQTTVDEFGQVVPAADPVSPEDDPFEQSRLDAEQQLNDEPIEFDPADVDPEDDPFEAERLEREQELNRQELAVEANEPEPVSPEDDPFEAERLEREQQLNDEPIEFEPADVSADDDPFEAERLEREQQLNRQELAETATEAEPVDASQDPGLSDQEILARQNPGGLSDEEILDRQANAAQKSAINQATLQARYKQPQNEDWRVRLSLSIGANYLYKDPSPGILAPLVKTDGVVFPYTPSIDTNYVANYTKTDLVHSNYRGAFYQNSSVQDVSIRGMFTAQDTSEAAYMLAVIHFFRSVTKMFYGKDSQRGAPPPLVYLSGFGDYQFAGHPCVVTNFAYTLPSDVDYIRANNPNNYGTDLLNRRDAALSSPTPFSGQQARQDILKSVGVFFGAPPSKPTQSPVSQTVANTNRATYVPTKIEIIITLLPMQTRDQISKQFSVKDFANGKLIQGGFW